MSNSQFKIECDVFSTLCWSIGTPVAYRALKMLERSDWLGLVSINVRPAHYVCAKTFLGDSQVASFFKKFPGFDLGKDLDSEARKTFFESEAQCYHSNERLNPLLSDSHHFGKGVNVFLKLWRKKIKNVLGRAPLTINLDGKFGPGSTYLNVGDKITLAHKLTDDYSTTQQATAFLQSWDQTAWSRYAACGLDTVGAGTPAASCQGVALYPGDDYHAPRDFTIVRGNRFTTVDKDARKKRGICIEPSLNVFYQLAVGDLISNRMLRRLGWDKRSCQDFHKSLARIGSLTEAISTIDLSNASDTICSVLVKLLLPHDWYCLVDSLRSPFTLIDNKWVRLEKFSSMGNGFTFELETLIFRTLCDTVCELEPPTEDAYTPGLTVSVFGDDIVVPASVSRSTIASLKFFGFTPNDSKTFVSGRFRESCGGDYFAGHDVRPSHLKEVCDAPEKLMALANSIRRFGVRFDTICINTGTPGIGAYRSSWFRCLDSIPRQIRICRGPESLGDIVIHDDESHWLSRNPVVVRNSIRYLRVWRPVANAVISFDHFRPGVVLAIALYGGSSGAPSSYSSSPNAREILRRSGIVPRVNGSYVSGYRFGRVAYS
jgi:hypothetical protein